MLCDLSALWKVCRCDSLRLLRWCSFKSEICVVNVHVLITATILKINMLHLSRFVHVGVLLKITAHLRGNGYYYSVLKIYNKKYWDYFHSWGASSNSDYPFLRQLWSRVHFGHCILLVHSMIFKTTLNLHLYIVPNHFCSCYYIVECRIKRRREVFLS